MRYVIFNWVHPDDAAAWEAMSEAERSADVERHMEWFRAHGAKVVGGEELAAPSAVKTLRPGRQGEDVVVTDGPYIETKEILGGFVIVEVETMDEAVSMPREWPSLASQPNATLQVQPGFVR